MGSRHLSSRPFGTRSFAGVPGSKLPGYSRMSLRDGTKMFKLQHVAGATRKGTVVRW
jgi:hypothetical protein